MWLSGSTAKLATPVSTSESVLRRELLSPIRASKGERRESRQTSALRFSSLVSLSST